MVVSLNCRLESNKEEEKDLSEGLQGFLAHLLLHGVTLTPQTKPQTAPYTPNPTLRTLRPDPKPLHPNPYTLKRTGKMWTAPPPGGPTRQLSCGTPYFFFFFITLEPTVE